MIRYFNKKGTETASNASPHSNMMLTDLSLNTQKVPVCVKIKIICSHSLDIANRPI